MASCSFDDVFIIYFTLQMIAVERIMELCHLEPEGEWYGEVPVPGYWPELGLITAEGMSFKYHPTLPRVLRNFNFCIRPQEKVQRRTGQTLKTLT